MGKNAILQGWKYWQWIEKNESRTYEMPKCKQEFRLQNEFWSFSFWKCFFTLKIIYNLCNLPARIYRMMNMCIKWLHTFLLLWTNEMVKSKQKSQKKQIKGMEIDYELLVAMWMCKNLDRFLFDENFITHHLTSMIICIFWRNIINQTHQLNFKRIWNIQARYESKLNYSTQTKYHLDCTRFCNEHRKPWKKVGSTQVFCLWR